VWRDRLERLGQRGSRRPKITAEAQRLPPDGERG